MTRNRKGRGKKGRSGRGGSNAPRGFVPQRRETPSSAEYYAYIGDTTQIASEGPEPCDYSRRAMNAARKRRL